MIRQLAIERPAATGSSNDGSAIGLVAAAAAIRGAAVAASGLLLTTGLALVLWAVTPASGDDVAAALQGGVTAFAAANLMPVVIGGVTFTLPPLLLTSVIAGLFFCTVRRGRFAPVGRYQEAVSVLLTAAVYGLVVAITTRGLGTEGAVPAGWVWTAAALALVSTAAGMLRCGSAWHAWWTRSALGWLRIGARGGWIGLWVMIAGGGLALSAGLIINFGSGVAIAAIAAPSWTDGLGMAMLGAAYVPNAVMAGVGYVSWVGFEIGPGTYSPLATSIVELPGVPLLAAAPDHAGRSWVGLAFLVVPVVAGCLIARSTVKALTTRSDRLLGAGLAAVLTGALVAAVSAIARGGVGDGRWSTIGAPPLLVGAVVAAEVGIVAVAWAALAGGRGVPWQPAKAGNTKPKRAAAAAAAGAAADGDGDGDGDGEDDLLLAETPAADTDLGEVTADDEQAESASGDEALGDAALDDAFAGEAALNDAISGEAALNGAAAGEATRDDAAVGAAALDDAAVGAAALDDEALGDKGLPDAPGDSVPAEAQRPSPAGPPPL